MLDVLLVFTTNLCLSPVTVPQRQTGTSAWRDKISGVQSDFVTTVHSLSQNTWSYKKKRKVLIYNSCTSHTILKAQKKCKFMLDIKGSDWKPGGKTTPVKGKWATFSYRARCSWPVQATHHVKKRGAESFIKVTCHLDKISAKCWENVPSYKEATRLFGLCENVWWGNKGKMNAMEPVSKQKTRLSPCL